MRIGMITGEYPPMQGGIGAYTRILAGEMAKQGNDLFVLSREGTLKHDSRIQLQATIQQWGLGSLRAARQWAHDESA